MILLSSLQGVTLLNQSYILLKNEGPGFRHVNIIGYTQYRRYLLPEVMLKRSEFQLSPCIWPKETNRILHSLLEALISCKQFRDNL